MTFRSHPDGLTGVAAGIFIAGLLALLAGFTTAKALFDLSEALALIGLIQMAIAAAMFTVLHILVRKEPTR